MIHEESSKSQAPSSREIPNSKLQKRRPEGIGMDPSRQPSPPAPAGKGRGRIVGCALAMVHEAKVPSYLKIHFFWKKRVDATLDFVEAGPAAGALLVAVVGPPGAGR